MFIAIMKVENNRVAKYAAFQSGEEALAHVAAHTGQWPNAFVVNDNNIAGPLREWWVVGQTVTVQAIPPTAEELEQAALGQEFDAAKLDNWIIQFLAMTPSGAQTYVQNNTATLADMRTVVGRLAYTVRFLLKRELR